MKCQSKMRKKKSMGKAHELNYVQADTSSITTCIHFIFLFFLLLLLCYLFAKWTPCHAYTWHTKYILFDSLENLKLGELWKFFLLFICNIAMVFKGYLTINKAGSTSSPGLSVHMYVIPYETNLGFILFEYIDFHKQHTRSSHGIYIGQSHTTLYM